MPRLNENSALLLKTAIDSGITSPAELANIMGNSAVETEHFSTMHEDFNYRSVDRLVSQVQSAIRRYSREEIQAAIDSRDPQQIATVMYEGRSNPRDLGNTEPGDGWRFHGRGYFQYTGRSNYTEYSRKFGVDLVNNPDLAADPEMAAKLAIAYWKDKVPEHMRDDPLAAGERINGGRNGAGARAIASRQWANTVTPELVDNIRSGRLTLEQLAETTVQDRGQSDPTVAALQQNLNTLGILDAERRPLVVDGDRGGPNSNTNEAIAAFQQQAGLTGQMSNADLLAATQAALNTRQALDADQALRDMLPENVRAPNRVNGTPDYLVPERGSPDQVAPVTQPPAPQPPHLPRHAGWAPGHGTTPAADAPVRLPPMPQAEQLQFGASGAAVFALQEHLRLLNARDAEGRELKPDRDYGTSTREAVENFQLWAGLPTTGTADRATLDALKEHAAYAMEQRAKGIAPSEHLGDNLKPGMPDAQMAAAERPVQGQGPADAPAQTAPASASLPPYSDPRNPNHALYAEVKTTLEGMGYRLPEDRLHQITGQMEMNGMRAGPQNQYAIRDDNNTFYVTSDIPGYRAHQNLNEPIPAIKDTMQEVMAYQQAQAMELSRGPDGPDRGAPTR